MSNRQSTRRTFLKTAGAATAAVVRNGKVYLLYRADDKSPDLKWGRTCRIGLAHSEDGILLVFNGPDWEKKRFTGRTTVANGLVYFKGQWLLYYGAADRVIGLATCTRNHEDD